MKQIIRLTEGDLHRLVLEVVNNVMNQGSSPSADAVAKMIYALTGIDVKQRMLGESMLYEGKGHVKSKRPATRFRFKKDENGEKIIQKIDRKYGEKLEATDYPEIDEKDGFYVTWDKPEIEELQTDETITASYTRYLTTISDKENSDDDFYQSDILQMCQVPVPCEVYDWH